MHTIKVMISCIVKGLLNMMSILAITYAKSIKATSAMIPFFFITISLIKIICVIVTVLVYSIVFDRTRTTI